MLLEDGDKTGEITRASEQTFNVKNVRVYPQASKIGSISIGGRRNIAIDFDEVPGTAGMYLSVYDDTEGEYIWPELVNGLQGPDVFGDSFVITGLPANHTYTIYMACTISGQTVSGSMYAY